MSPDVEIWCFQTKIVTWRWKTRQIVTWRWAICHLTYSKNCHLTILEIMPFKDTILKILLFRDTTRRKFQKSQRIKVIILYYCLAHAKRVSRSRSLCHVQQAVLDKDDLSNWKRHCLLFQIAEWHESCQFQEVII